MKYEINKETIIKYKMKDEFPEVFKFTGWAKSKESGYKEWMGYFENNILKYGISILGNWFDNGYRNYDSTSYYPATHEEIETGLIGMAERLEFKDGTDAEGVTKGINKTGLNFNDLFYSIEINMLTDGSGHCVFYNGKWAEIIKEPLTLEQRIERIEKIHGL